MTINEIEIHSFLPPTPSLHQRLHDLFRHRLAAQACIPIPAMVVASSRYYQIERARQLQEIRPRSMIQPGMEYFDPIQTCLYQNCQTASVQPAGCPVLGQDRRVRKHRHASSRVYILYGVFDRQGRDRNLLIVGKS